MEIKLYSNIQQIVSKLIVLDDYDSCVEKLLQPSPLSMHIFDSVKCCENSKFCFRANSGLTPNKERHPQLNFY